MEIKKEISEYYISLEEIKKLAKKNAIILGFAFTLALLALFGLAFYPYDVFLHLSWIFGSYRSPLLISFSIILLLPFSIFIGLFLTVYLWKYISIKKIMKEFN